MDADHLRKKYRRHSFILSEPTIDKLVSIDPLRDIKFTIDIMSINSKCEIPKSTVEINITFGKFSTK